MKDNILVAHQRLVDALSDDLLCADAAEVLASHTGAEARVIADAMRQAIRRRLPETSPSRPFDEDLLRGPIQRPAGQEKKP